MPDDGLNFKVVADDLEARASRLSQENNPKNLGIDEVVLSVSRLVKALGIANESANKQSRNMLWLTIALGAVALLQLFIAYGQYKWGEVQIDASHEQNSLQDVIWKYDMMRDDRIEQRDINWRREDLEAAGRLPVYPPTK